MEQTPSEGVMGNIYDRFQDKTFKDAFRGIY